MDFSIEQPEQHARQQIDALLTAAGWVVQSRAELDRTAALGVALRELPHHVSKPAVRRNRKVSSTSPARSCA